MASIGRVTLSLASGVMETTAALANFNFDFSIIRMEAPAEYRSIGNNISKRRKQEAEEGKIHTTARKLGALFADIVPRIPNLEKLYGLRASEVVENRAINPEETSSYGALQGYVGLDATSIWAAATSGRGAIQVHLLACILARQWPPSEAISIWSELVSARKTEVESLLQEDQFHLGQLMASQVDVGPSKLAQWDASARSWLHAADKTFPLQQKQLMLIIDNLGYNLSSQDAVYQTVLRVWCSALSFMENIASGMALSADDTDVFLGLSAWHLYPDMTVLGSEPKHIIQKDKLIPESSVVTVGLQGPHSSKYATASGITWTIPLARLKYYGKPEMATSNVGISSGRAPFETLIRIALGSLVCSWGEHATDLTRLAEFFAVLTERCAVESSAANADWVKMFADELKKYTLLREVEKTEFARYVNLGRRRFRNFVDTVRSPSFLGLCNASTFMAELTTEEKIAYLRAYASEHQSDLDLTNAIVLYGDGLSSGIASALPQSFGISDNQHVQNHRRWILLHQWSQHEIGIRGHDTEPATPSDSMPSPAVHTLVAAGEHSTHLMDETFEPCGFLLSGTIVNPNSGKTYDIYSSHGAPPPVLQWKPIQVGVNLDVLEKAMKEHSEIEVSKQHISGWKIASARSQYEGIKFRLLAHMGSTAIYVPVSQWEPNTILQTSVDFMAGQIAKLPAHTDSITRILNKTMTEPTLRSLTMLSHAAKIYSTMRAASIDLTVASDPLHTAHWFSSTTNFATSALASTFACICKFDSGIDLQPLHFAGAMGISSNDVLYVCNGLLDFPIKDNRGVRCVPGNIGKPGVCVLTSPSDLDVRDSLHDWNLINHFPFDGKLEDSFHTTSLHLRLTGAELPLDVGRRGNLFNEAKYVDAVVQVYDRGQWFTDIDVMTLYMDPGDFMMQNGVANSSCAHSEAERIDYTAPGTISTVDNWPELIEPPLNLSVVRAHGNWSARLALACFIRKRGHPLRIANGDLCWTCVASSVAVLGADGFILL